MVRATKNLTCFISITLKKTLALQGGNQQAANGFGRNNSIKVKRESAFFELAENKLKRLKKVQDFT